MRIHNRSELKSVLKIERQLWIRFNYPKSNPPKLVAWKKELQFVKTLRHVEYAMGLSGIQKWIIAGYGYWRVKYFILSRYSHVMIPPFVFEEGLLIAHLQNIIVSSAVQVGKYCCLFHNVTMGVSIGVNDKGKCPKIGNGVTICCGAGLFGNIELADGITVGANAVVTKSFHEKNCVIGGIPAKVIGKEAGFQMLKFKDTIKV